MSLRLSLVCALGALGLFTIPAQAGLIKNAGSASTSNVTTTTPGQKSILMTIDPFNVSSFQLDVSFEASKVAFVAIRGLNGYIIDNDFNIIVDGNTGFITDIHGYFPGFNDRVIPGPPESFAPVPGLPAVLPPAGEVDIFEVEFLVLRPDLDKTFGVFASQNDYITGIDPATGNFTTASGPVNVDGLGVAPAFSTVPGLRGGDPSAPLPAAAWVGLISGAGVVANKLRRRKAA